MMNNKAQVSPWGILFGIIGVIITLIILRGFTEVGIFWKMVSIIGTGFACYMIGHMASEN